VRYYFDTSALCRYYHPEPGSVEVDRIVNEPGALHILSWLTAMEVQSAFAVKVRTGLIDAVEFSNLRKRVRTDIAAKRFVVVRVLRRHYSVAEDLLTRYGGAHRIRSLDALHLAIAMDLQRSGRIDQLITADTLQATIAPLEGVSVFNPLAP
jgi:predicted nucleic acid-binding protein